MGISGKFLHNVVKLFLYMIEILTFSDIPRLKAIFLPCHLKTFRLIVGIKMRGTAELPMNILSLGVSVIFFYPTILKSVTTCAI